MKSLLLFTFINSLHTFWQKLMISFRLYSNRVINFFYNINNVKLLLFMFIFTYFILLVIVLYFLFRNYKTHLVLQNTQTIMEMNKDIIQLFKNNQINGVTLPNMDRINMQYLYHLLDINGYKDILYNTSPNSHILESILNQNPAVKSKLAEIALQDITGSHLELLTDFIKQYLKIALKISSPLIAAVIGMTLIAGFESLLPLVAANAPMLAAPILA